MEAYPFSFKYERFKRRTKKIEFGIVLILNDKRQA